MDTGKSYIPNQSITNAWSDTRLQHHDIDPSNAFIPKLNHSNELPPFMTKLYYEQVNSILRTENRNRGSDLFLALFQRQKQQNLIIAYHIEE